MHDQYRKRRSPAGFVFLNDIQTKNLQEQVRAAQKLIIKSGFTRVMPPAIDYYETFQDSPLDLFSFRDNQGTNLAMRNDVTVQLIKAYSNQFENETIEKANHKFYYTVPVFVDRENELREVHQLGVEHIGVKQEESIPQLILLAHDILKESFGVDHRILVGDVKAYHILEDYLAQNISRDKRSILQLKLKQAIHKKDAPALSELLISRKWHASKAKLFARELLYLSSEISSSEELNTFLEKLKVNCVDANLYKSLLQCWSNIISVLDYIKKEQKVEIPISLEPALIRTTGYYTGLIFEGFTSGLSFPPLRGGAYDSLVEQYSNKSIPASGFALDASSIIG